MYFRFPLYRKPSMQERTWLTLYILLEPFRDSKTLSRVAIPSLSLLSNDGEGLVWFLWSRRVPLRRPPLNGGVYLKTADNLLTKVPLVETSVVVYIPHQTYFAHSRKMADVFRRKSRKIRVVFFRDGRKMSFLYRSKSGSRTVISTSTCMRQIFSYKKLKFLTSLK